MAEKRGTNWKMILYGIVALYAVMGINRLITGTPVLENKEPTKNYAPKKPVTKLRKTLKGGYFACISEDLFDEISMASANKDNLQIGTLLSKGCVLTKTGVRFSYISGISFGVAKIRAYDGTDSIILYTNHENVYY